MIQQRNKIIADLYNSKDFNDCINKMEPDHLRDDLKQEVMLILLGKEPGLICGLAERNELKWYVVRVILNTACSDRSPFAKMYRQVTSGIIPELPYTELNGRVQKEINEEPIYVILKQVRPLAYQKNPTYLPHLFPIMSWYDQYILSLYMKLGTFRKMEVETKIPWESCYGTVKKVILKIRKEVVNVAK